MDYRIITTILCLLLTIYLPAHSQDQILRHPSISNDGKMIAFSYQGDIWTSDLEGSNIQRLTVHPGYEGWPVWSSDNQHIAFSGYRFGHKDVFTIPVQGGLSQRLTFHSSSDEVHDWNQSGQVVFTTMRNFKHVEREDEIYAVSQEGGTPVRILDALGEMPAVSPNGRLIAFVMGSCRTERENYQGPANKDIWIYNKEDQSYIKITESNGNDFLPRFSGNNTLYYIGLDQGFYRINMLSLDETGNPVESPAAVTKNDDFGIFHFDVDPDSEHIVYEKMGRLYHLNSATGETNPIRFNFRADYRFDPVEYKSYTSNISEYVLSPNGKLNAFKVRGEVFVKQNDKERSRSVNLSEHPNHDKDITWLNDSSLIFASDRKGQYDLFLVRSTDPKVTGIYKTLKKQLINLTSSAEDEVSPKVSPDGKKIAFVKDNTRLIVADIDPEGKLSNIKTLIDSWSVPNSIEWSPDSRWLAYAQPNLDFNYEVYIHAADNSQGPVNISMHPRSDRSPLWSPDGSKLAFISDRNNGDYDVWFAWLQKEEWQKTKEDRLEGLYQEEPELEKDTTAEEKETEPITIDFEDIHYRLSQVTSLAGDEANFAIDDEGETFFYSTENPAAKGSDLYSIKFDGSEVKQVTSGGVNPHDLALSDDGNHLYFLKKGGALTRLDIGLDKQEVMPFKADMKINHVAEREQIFEEAWRQLNLNFYDPDFHGQNFDQLKSKYQDATLNASTRRDFREMFNRMLGQLNASHMGLYGSDRAETADENTGLLGLEVEPVTAGLKITHVIPDSPADRNQSKLNEGEVITSVNGQAIATDQNFYELLTNKASEQLILTIQNQQGKSREVVIRPTSSLSQVQYQEWVNQRKALTEQYSQGRLGYIHIQGMNWTSFERFERELTASGLGKEGIVIDVRYNGGGWTTDYLMAVLNVRQHAYTIPRGAARNLEKENEQFTQHYPFGERLPLAAWTRPSIALCNSSSYSNAEIFSHAYKTLDLGTLVGEPTFGAVISTGGYSLMDDSFVRLPFRAWYVKATGENMETTPATPDIIVHNDPDYKAKQEDAQLRKAVEQLLKEIDGN
ncbi:MAG: S41 family peptidase [Candidatus Cyclobacteriaceae bacterium M3_2C_046]